MTGRSVELISRYGVIYADPPNVTRGKYSSRSRKGVAHG